MRYQFKMLMDELDKTMQKVRTEEPLIHCITNPISINACANAVLALGAKPIMAEHPLEVEDITSSSKALAVNLGNITDARIKSIMISGNTAKDKGIPSVIDLVGVACSKLRLHLAQEYISKCSPAIIKGNISEIKAMAGQHCSAKGIDAGAQDAFAYEDVSALKAVSDIVKNYASDTNSVVIASGQTDIISDGNDVFCIRNGNSFMPKVTGTGCMLNVCAATFLSSSQPLVAAILSTVIMGICGELADCSKGTGTFAVELMDRISTITIDQIKMYIKIISI